MAEILLSNISKRFNGKKVLKDINLLVKEGEMIALLGPSGCGKTTTLKIIAGLLEPDGGNIFVNEQSILKIPVEKRGAVIVFQDYLLFPHLTVEQNIGFGLKMAKSNPEFMRSKVKEMVNLVELNEQEKKFPHELSGGQKQRVAIARALAIEPKVLLLDEPFSNLDSRLRENMREFICSIQRKLNITTILVTHDKEEALMTSDRIAIMLDGEIKQFDNPKILYEKPISMEVANFLGETNYLKGTIKNGVFSSPIGKIKTDLIDLTSVTAMIRPEKIEMSGIKENKGMIGRIVSKKYAGDRVYYGVLLNDLVLKCTATTKEIFDVDQEVILKVDTDSLIFY